MTPLLRLLPFLCLASCVTESVDGQESTGAAAAQTDIDPGAGAQAGVNYSSDTPEAVAAAFAAKYPGESSAEWRRDRNDSYEAHFTQEGERMRADFTPAGVWIETERSVKWGDLPQAVQNAIKAEYKKDDIVELEYTENAERGEFYDVEIDPKGGKKFDVEYRADGSKVR